MWNGRRNEGEKRETSTFYLSAAINLNNANPTVDPPRRPIDQHNPTHASPSDTACHLQRNRPS
jgi:hypothetical protein